MYHEKVFMVMAESWLRFSLMSRNQVTVLELISSNKLEKISTNLLPKLFMKLTYVATALCLTTIFCRAPFVAAESSPVTPPEVFGNP